VWTNVPGQADVRGSGALQAMTDTNINVTTQVNFDGWGRKG
jgi:hypothetical protein